MIEAHEILIKNLIEDDVVLMDTVIDLWSQIYFGSNCLNLLQHQKDLGSVVIVDNDIMPYVLYQKNFLKIDMIDSNVK